MHWFTSTVHCGHMIDISHGGYSFLAFCAKIIYNTSDKNDELKVVKSLCTTSDPSVGLVCCRHIIWCRAQPPLSLEEIKGSGD